MLQVIYIHKYKSGVCCYGAICGYRALLIWSLLIIHLRPTLAKLLELEIICSERTYSERSLAYNTLFSNCTPAMNKLGSSLIDRY